MRALNRKMLQSLNLLPPTTHYEELGDTVDGETICTYETIVLLQSFITTGKGIHENGTRSPRTKLQRLQVILDLLLREPMKARGGAGRHLDVVLSHTHIEGLPKVTADTRQMGTLKSRGQCGCRHLAQGSH